MRRFQRLVKARPCSRSAVRKVRPRRATRPQSLTARRSFFHGARKPTKLVDEQGRVFRQFDGQPIDSSKYDYSQAPEGVIPDIVKKTSDEWYAHMQAQQKKYPDTEDLILFHETFDDFKKAFDGPYTETVRKRLNEDYEFALKQWAEQPEDFKQAYLEHNDNPENYREVYAGTHQADIEAKFVAKREKVAEVRRILQDADDATGGVVTIEQNADFMVRQTARALGTVGVVGFTYTFLKGVGVQPEFMPLLSPDSQLLVVSTLPVIIAPEISQLAGNVLDKFLLNPLMVSNFLRNQFRALETHRMGQGRRKRKLLDYMMKKAKEPDYEQPRAAEDFRTDQLSSSDEYAHDISKFVKGK